MKESNKQRSKRAAPVFTKPETFSLQHGMPTGEGRPSSLYLWIALATAVLYMVVL